MTDEQFEKCKRCLYRKKGATTKENICNIIGKNLNFEGDCSSFRLDKNAKPINTPHKTKKSLKPNLKRAKIAQYFIWLVLAMEIISIMSSYMQYDLLQTVKNGEFITEEAIDFNDNREFVVAVLYFIAYIISGITFIMWFQRAYYNLHQIVDNLSYGEAWAAGSWFVPFINLYRPYQIMKELYKTTIELLTKKGSIKKSISAGFLGWWWMLWIVDNVFARISLRLPMETVDQMMTSTIVDMVDSIITIPLALITIKLIKEYAAIEPLLKRIKFEEKINDNQLLLK